MSIEVGDVYGPYTVVGGSPEGSGFRCECRCGRSLVVEASDLVACVSDGCLCRRRRRPRRPDEDPFGEAFVARLAERAARRKIDFDLTSAVLQRKWEEQGGRCLYSGLRLILGRSGSASLDRLDSSRGYRDDNVAWCHKDVNMMKQSYSPEKFFWLCQRVSDWNQRRYLCTRENLKQD